MPLKGSTFSDYPDYGDDRISTKGGGFRDNRKDVAIPMTIKEVEALLRYRAEKGERKKRDRDE